MALAILEKLSPKKKEAYVPLTGLLGNADDYNIHRFTQKEKLRFFLLGGVASGALLYIFYESIFASLILGAVMGYFLLPVFNRWLVERRRKKLLLQFKDLLDALNTSLGTGKNVFDAFSAAQSDLAVEYPSDADILREVAIILNGITNNMQIEDLLKDLGQRSGLKEIIDFAAVFETCYRKGANMQQVIHNTVEVITDEIEIGMEIQTMVSGQKSEQNVMLFMPIVFVVMLKTMGGNLVDLSTPVGVACMTAALVLFGIAFWVSRKILDIKL